MKRVRVVAIAPMLSVFYLWGAPALAQAPAGPPSFSAAVNRMHASIRRNIVEAAEKMPEEHYASKVGPMSEVRTFGGFIGHLANANFFFCSTAKGEKSPNATDYEKTVTAKAELVEGIKAAMEYCDAVYSAQTDQSLMETVKVSGPKNTQVDNVRAQLLVQNFGHNQEHYGNLVTYMRAKGLVPPSTERAQQQRRPGGQ